MPRCTQGRSCCSTTPSLWADSSAEPPSHPVLVHRHPLHRALNAPVPMRQGKTEMWTPTHREIVISKITHLTQVAGNVEESQRLALVTTESILKPSQTNLGIMSSTRRSGRGAPWAGAPSPTGSSPSPWDARALRPLLCPASGPNPDVSSQSQHVPNLLMNCSSLAKPNQSSCVGVQLMCIPGPGAGDKAGRQEPQGKRTVGPPSHKARDGHLSAAGVFFCENLSSVPALLLLQGPAYLCRCTFPGHFVSSFTRASTDRSQRPCPDLQAQTWELKCRIRKLKSSHLLQNPPRALLPRALGSWEKVSNLLFTPACCGLAVCGRHLCIHR
ncbi:uncharacterized protein LOC113920283 isoform X2 [Zalophus californianus]|uniref:Uncharacterized protein LOC113920283 isoform X2 n=1 Tax=Zalophus californianus TaxID=9704 RepID=A0A6J2CQ05_ZALCA|nr:uncharacterized protein LOC113920283 isoform X2 [Zalophus californianus]